MLGENICFGELIQIYHYIIDQAVSCENVEAKDFVPWVQGRPCRVVVAILRQLPKVDVPVLQFMMVVHGHSDLLHCDYQEVGTRGTSEEHLNFGDGVARSRPAKPKKRGEKNTKDEHYHNCHHHHGHL